MRFSSNSKSPSAGKQRLVRAGKWYHCWHCTLANDSGECSDQLLSFSVSRVLSANYVRMRDLSLIADWLFSSNLPPRAPHTRSAHLSALFTVSRTLTNSNLIFCLLVAIASGGRGCREIKVNPKLVYQNCDAPGLSDVARPNIYRQSLLFIVQMFDANVFARFFPVPNCVWGECD